MDTSKKKFPDFIIGGAMKSGTSSIHHILNTHKDIFIPNNELFYFDYDDIEQHRDFMLNDNEKITNYSLEKKYYWYQNQFNSFQENYLYGEDSTTYLASGIAPKRIYKMIPDVKFIFCLRNPVDRCYSHYYHLVKSKRINITFEKAININYGNILQRSFYKKQIDDYLKYFPKKNIKFIIFENFIENQQETINSLLDFLNLDHSIDLTKISTHKNKGRVPISMTLQLLYNNFGNKLSNINYKRKFNYQLSWQDKMLSFVDKVFSKVNLSSIKTRTDMDFKIKSVLNDYFLKKNQNLSELIDVDLKKYWYK